MSWSNENSFIHKIGIVIEEADESEFWLEFIIDEKLKTKKMVEDLRKEAYELTSIFIKSRKKHNRICKSSIDNQKSTIL